MRRVIKVAVILLLVAFGLGLFVKEESLLQVHYDTLAMRALKRTSFFGIEMKQSVEWGKEGFEKQYREIYDADPSADRWRSWPIRTLRLGSERLRSPVTPHSLSLRTNVVRRIFTRYEHNHSVQDAKDSFRALESILPGSSIIEDFGPERVQAAEERIAASQTLKSLESPKGSSGSEEQ